MTSSEVYQISKTPYYWVDFILLFDWQRQTIAATILLF